MLGWNLYGFFGYDNFGRHISWSPAYPEFMAGSGHIGAARDPRELQALVWRNFATSFTRGFNSYWMYGFTVHDWFEEDQVQHMVRRHLDAIKESIRWSHRTMPGIAMVLDDSGVLETNGNFLNEAIMWGCPGNWAALFMAAVQLPASLWRNIARFAGAHVYCESNDIVLANSSMVALHSLKGGPKRLVLPAPSNVRDVVANTEYARNTSEIEFDLDPPETRVFLLEP